MMRTFVIVLSAVALALGALAILARPPAAPEGLEEIAPGDAQFWLMQDGASDRHIPCTVRYRFDSSLDESLLRARLRELVALYAMFHRNVVEVDGLPYWQSAEVDWDRNFRILGPDESLEAVRIAADEALSSASARGEGLPLFRAFLSADGRELVFMWHHVISDFEGMFNVHARHLFRLAEERTRFGYQVSADEPETGDGSARALGRAFEARPLGFTGSAFDVERHVLPVTDVRLHELGAAAGLPMSDVFSLITVRAVTRYHEAEGPAEAPDIRPVVSPLSLRTSSLQIDGGNNRAIKRFPLVFPLEPVAATHARVLELAPASTSYERAGRALKLARHLSVLEEPLRRLTMPDYISNYFPLADGPLRLGDATLIRHDLRVPLVPYERAKFAWSNLDGEVQLFLHVDPQLVDAERMAASFVEASEEVIAFLRDGGT
jgi:hypothetical protein